MDLILKVKELIDAVRAGDTDTAIRLIWEILIIVAQAFLSKQATVASIRASMTASTAHDGMTEAEIADELEDICNQHAPVGAASVGGPFIDLILPYLIALLKKLLGI